nr:ABC transporter [Phyllobacterium bourgognense]
MSRILFAVVATLAVASLSACGTMGKGKAPPPVAEEPAAAPVYK